MSEVVVYKGRTNKLPISMGMDISNETFTSEIRTEPDISAPLIATWDVDFVTDGTDGELMLTLDNSATEGIQVNSGYMDLKRLSGTEPLPVFDRPLEVTFRGSVTA